MGTKPDGTLGEPGISASGTGPNSSGEPPIPVIENGNVDPSTVTATSERKSNRGGARSGAGRKPGNPASSGPATPSAKKTRDKVVVDAGLINMAVAMATGWIAARYKDEATREIMTLDASETENIAKAATHVASFYNVPVSPLTQAWMALGGVCFAIYSPRVMGLKARAALARKPAPVQPAQPFTPHVVEDGEIEAAE